LEMQWLYLSVVRLGMPWPWPIWTRLEMTLSWCFHPSLHSLMMYKVFQVWTVCMAGPSVEEFISSHAPVGKLLAQFSDSCFVNINRTYTHLSAGVRWKESGFPS
jgi:hypothetical protein